VSTWVSVTKKPVPRVSPHSTETTDAAGSSLGNFTFTGAGGSTTTPCCAAGSGGVGLRQAAATSSAAHHRLTE
jgi:hypothetical protein